MSLIEEVADLANLKLAWERTLSGKSDDLRERSKGMDDESLADFAKNAELNLKIISKTLLNGKYRLNSLKGFEIKKNKGNFRLITAPTVRDRIVHGAMLSIIQKFFLEIRNGSSYCLPRTPNRSERVNFIDAFRVMTQYLKEGNLFVFESDIESFFDKVDKEMFLSKMLKKLPDRSLDKLLRNIVYFKVGNIKKFQPLADKQLIKLPNEHTGLSQGSPLSPLFANVYLNEFDRGMINAFGKKYIRYVDDFIVLCPKPSETAKAYKLAVKLLKADELTLPSASGPKSKTRITIDLKEGTAFVFLGIQVNNKSLCPNVTITELKEHIDSKCFAMKSIKRMLEAKKKATSNEEKARVVHARLHSKFGVYGYFHTDELIKEVNKLIRLKSNSAMIPVKPITFSKKGMPLVSKTDWQSYF